MALAVARLVRNWRFKVGMQFLISTFLPQKMGFRLNEFLTVMTRNKSDRFDIGPRVKKGLENIALVQSVTGFDFVGKNCLELGTGWHGIDLIVLHLLGAKSIVTLDHHPHLTFDNLIFVLDELKKTDILGAVGGGIGPDGVSKFNLLMLHYSSWMDIDDAFKYLSVKAYIVDNCDVRKVEIDEKSIDFFFSESVLQRIPTVDLCEIMNHVGAKLMHCDGVFFHRTDQKDINSMDHVEGGLWPLEYLKYSDFVFHTFYSTRFNNQNRLRESDFIRIFEVANLHLREVHSFFYSKDIQRVEQAKLAHCFKGKCLEDVAIRHSKFIGQMSYAGGTHRSVQRQ